MKGQLLISHCFLLIKQIAAGEKKKEKSSRPSENIPALFGISHQFLFQYEP